jgi:hypothetical protein
MAKDFLQIRFSKDEKDELHRIAAQLGPETSASQIVREAIREKVSKLKRKLEADAQKRAAIAQ